MFRYIFSALSRHGAIFRPQHPQENLSAASWHIVCCDFCCERTDRDPFCAKNVFFVCRNHNSAKLTILHRQHDPLPPTWSFPTNMIFSHQHDPVPPTWSFPTSILFFLPRCFLIFSLNRTTTTTTTTINFWVYLGYKIAYKSIFEPITGLRRYSSWIRVNFLCRSMSSIRRLAS